MGLNLNFRRAGRASSTANVKKGFRPDIQGLRAFAVIVVILDHLAHWPRGGFIGVDVFLVISGFLITGHLLREYDKTRHISFVDFYKKRVKRIMPAAVLVLLVTVSTAYLIFNERRFQSTVWDAIWGLLFGANWRFAAIGTDYFQADGPVSPLQHYWSLAVEEQFYFVWPWLLLAGFWLFLRGHRHGNPKAARLVAGVAVLTVSALSLAWAVYETSANPGVAYFSTFSRGWELGAGAFLAVIVPMLARIPQSMRPYLAWVGISGLVLSVFLINESIGFPAPAALLPVLSASVVIAAGVDAKGFVGLGVLTNPVAGYLGNISYSLYLWHFPVIVFLGEFMEASPTFYLLATVGMLAISIFSYHLVEDPIRRSAWLDGGLSPKKASQGLSAAYGHTALGFLAVSTAVVVVAALYTPVNTPAVALPPPAMSENALNEPATKTATPALAALQTEINAALTAVSWPDLSPSMDDAIGSPQTPEAFGKCGNPDGFIPEACTLGDPAAPKTAMVLGDSVSMTMVNPLHLALGDTWKVVSHGMFGCVYSAVTASNSNAGIAEACPIRNDAATSLAKDLDPDLIFIANTYAPRMAQGQTKTPSADEWSEAIKTQASKLGVDPKKIILLSAPPAGKNPAECYKKISSPADCVSPKTPEWSKMLSAQIRIATNQGWKVMDTSNLFCNANSCPAFANGVPMKADTAHITIEYGQMMVPALRELIDAAMPQG